MAATVAVGEPHKQPNSIHEKIVTTPRPPGIQPTAALAKSISRREMPPLLISAPANIKNGMAASVKLSTEENIFCTEVNSGIKSPATMAAIPPPTSASAIGIPRIVMTAKTRKSVAVIMLQSPPSDA